MPPSATIDGFLDEEIRQSLLAWTLRNADRFTPATVTHDDVTHVHTESRDNLKLGDLGPLEAPIRQRMLAALPQLAQSLGCEFPREVLLELELTAYGDGAFYEPHMDTVPRGQLKDRRLAEPDPRLLSAVYYFHREPKSFGGGALRIYRWGASDDVDPNNYRDLEPADNRLAVFLSWTRHEVRPVSCPSGRFEDYRFALNCWYRTPVPLA
jgi:Rps23 Pro-64 3,4-dihydroxylase Tpa1-like proline 4-hydroxylase